MGAGRKTQTYYLPEKLLHKTSVNGSITARNLRKSDLGAVIFGCKHKTIKECFTKQLFGLLGPHYSYVKNIDPGLPLFLFNYNDRKLHGIFEATSHGGWNIDPNAWAEDDSATTPYSAQVRMRIQMQCHPLAEDQFCAVITKNYYKPNLFWFELDHDQTDKLISLFSSSLVTANALPHTPNVRQGNDSFETLGGFQASGARYMTSNLLLKPWNALFTVETCPAARELTEKNKAESSNETMTSLNTSIADHIGVEICADAAIPEKSWSGLFIEYTGLDAREITLGDNSEPSDASTENVEILDPNKSSIEMGMGTALPEKPWSVWHDEENLSYIRQPTEGIVGESSEADSEERINSEKESLDLCFVVAKLLLELEDWKLTQLMQVQKVSRLENELVQSRNEIKQLKNRCKMLEYVSFPSMDHLEDGSTLEEFNACSDELILVGGFDGSSWLLGLDSYSPSQDLIKSISSMNAVRRYGSAGKFLGGASDSAWYDTVESYNLRTDQWTSRPFLKQRKGSLASVSLDDKLFAIGGGDGVECFSEVEMFDLGVGRWIPTQSMLNTRFAAAAAEINGMLYVAGGYNGKQYMKSVERYDLWEHSWVEVESMTTKRGSHSLIVLNEKLYALGGYDGCRMVSTVEVFDPRNRSWMVAESMNNSRGYFGAVVMGDVIYAFGGLSNDSQVLDTVECFREGHGWQVVYSEAIGKRCFLSAVVV